MLERSIESLEVHPHDQLIIISQKHHHLPNHLPHVSALWLELEESTSGQLDTFMRSFNLIKNDKVVIFNCDTHFKASQLRSAMDDDSFDGIVTCSKQPGTSWSFCQVNQDSFVTEIEEKIRISNWASVGHYYFKDKNQLMSFIASELKRSDVSEHYVAPLYKKYLALNMKILMIPAEEFLPFGSIEQIQDYWGINLGELEAENV